MARTCANCGATIGGQADRLYCSTACPVAGHRARHRPPPRMTLVALVDALGFDETAEARAEAALVIGVAHAASRSWQAAAWLLDRRFPERWAKADRDAHGGDLVGHSIR